MAAIEIDADYFQEFVLEIPGFRGAEKIEAAFRTGLR